MGNISRTVEKSLKEALKSKDTKRASVLRMLKASLINEKIAKGEDLSGEEEVKIVRREVKKRKESIESFKKADREERVKEEQSEVEVLKNLLPPEMSDEEIRQITEKVITELGDDNFGKIMGAVMKQVGTQASGDRVKKIVEEELGK